MTVRMPVSPDVILRTDRDVGVDGEESIQIGGRLDPAVFRRWIQATLMLADRKLMKRVHHRVRYDEDPTPIEEQEPVESPEAVEVLWTTSARARYVHVILTFQQAAGKASPPELSVELVVHNGGAAIDPGWTSVRWGDDGLNPITESWPPRVIGTGWTPPLEATARGFISPLHLLDQQSTTVRLIVSGTYIRVISVDIQEFGDGEETAVFTPNGEV